MATRKETQKSSDRSGTDTIDKIENALRALGSGWHSRAEIAAYFDNKKLLNISELAALETLVNTGRVDLRRARRDATAYRRFEYRLKEKSSQRGTPEEKGV